MIKRTLLFANPAYLSTKNEQLLFKPVDNESAERTVPIEDIGVVVLENRQITITNGLLDKLIQNKVAVISCDNRHMPVGLLMPLEGHTEQQMRFQYQLEASQPLKKNLWQQTVQAKIYNQAKHLELWKTDTQNMHHWVRQVTSGDKINHEARAAAYYWKHLFEPNKFTRRPDGEVPNNLLNYGYAILRAITARALVSSGLLPTLGIFHRNKYNAYCLADDVMEPYRPFVDWTVRQLVDEMEIDEDLSPRNKQALLKMIAMDVVIDDKLSPLMVAMSRTTSSLFECFAGNRRKLLYPQFAAHM